MRKLGGCVRGKEGYEVDSQRTIGAPGKKASGAPAPLALLVFVAAAASLVFYACAGNPPPGGPPDSAQLCVACRAVPSLPGCKELLASGACGTTTTTSSTSSTSSTTTTTQPPAETPHPVCSLEVPRIVDCYHNPTGQQWLYACPLVDGASVNVPAGQEATCPAAPPPGPDPEPPPSGAVCSFPQGLAESDYHFSTGLPTLGDRVNAAVAAIGLCNVGSACPLGTDPQLALRRIIVKLQLAGLCAGQDVNGESDQLDVSLSCASGSWETFHAVKWPNVPGVDQAMAVWAGSPTQPCLGGRDAHGIPAGLGCPGVNGGSYRGALSIAPSFCPTAPPAGACPVTPAMLDGTEPFRADVKPHTSSAGSGVDATLWGCGYALVARLRPNVPACLNFCCPLEGDKSATVDLNACAASLWGTARYTPESSDVGIITTPNTNTVAITGSGTVKLCGTLDPTNARACWTFAYPCTPDAADATKCQKNHR